MSSMRADAGYPLDQIDGVVMRRHALAGAVGITWVSTSADDTPRTSAS